MSDLIQPGTKKSFWQRPEGKTGKALVGGAGLLGLFVVYQYDILGKLIALAQDAIQLTVLGAVLVALYLVLTSQRVHSLVFYAFQMIARAITSWFVEIDPIAILKSFVSQMRKRRDEVVVRLTHITGVRRTLQAEVKRSEKEMGEALRLAKAAQSVSDDDGLNAHAEIAGRRQRNIENYRAMEAEVGQVEALLQKVLKRVDYHITNAEDETRELVRMFQVTKETSAATKAAWKVLGHSDLLDVRNEAADRIRERYELAMGELQTLVQMTDFDNAVDLQQIAFRADGRKQLEELERKMTEIERGGGAETRLLTAGSVGGTLPFAGIRQPEAVPVSDRWSDVVKKEL
jgi:hypothetical protein